MIKKPNNWENVQAFAERQKLPVGAYVCKIRSAVVKNDGYGDQLCILFDIEDGEYAGYYAADYKANQREDKKWKGVLRYWLPKDDGSEKDEWTKSSFKGLIASIENSNKRYTWDWDERSLAGKEIGIIFRNEEWEFKGKTGWTARPFRATSVDSVADCSYTIPKDKPLKAKSSSEFGSYAAPVSEYGGYTSMEEDDDQMAF